MKTDANDSHPIAKKAGLIARLFRGDVSLPVTFWVFSFIIGDVVVRAIRMTIEAHSFKIYSTQAGVWAVQGIVLFLMGYRIFMLIATWRSAGKYQGNALWAALARIAVVFTALIILASTIGGLQEKGEPALLRSEAVKLMNKSLPSMINEDIRLDHISIQGIDLHYSCTLVNWSAEELDIPSFMSEMTQQMQASLCADEEMRKRLKEGSRLVYIFKDKNDRPVDRIVLEETDCLRAEQAGAGYPPQSVGSPDP